MSKLKVVNQYSRDGVLLARYPSLSNASVFSQTQVAHIGKAAAGLRNSAGGYNWKFTKVLGEVLAANLLGSIQQIDVGSGEVVAIYRDIPTANLLSGISERKISSILSGKVRTTEGYRFITV